MAVLEGRRFGLVLMAVVVVLPWPVGAARLPTALPTDTTSLIAVNAGYSGTMPTQLGDLTNLDKIELTFNNLNGSLPTEIGRWTLLEGPFGFQANALTSSIPTEVGLLTGLTENLLLHSNALTGDLPSEVGHISLITASFNVIENKLNGTVPSQIGAMTAISYVLKLHSNQLHSSLPSEIGRLSALGSVFTIRDTLLSQTMPTQVGYMTSMYYNFRASRMKMTGRLPSEIGMLTKMFSKFQISENYFDGAFPTQLGQLNSMVSYFYVYNNLFNGTLPSQLGEFTGQALAFRVESNQLSGALPTELGRLTVITSNYNVNANEFCDDVPSEVQALSSAVVSSWQITTGNDFGTRCCTHMSGVVCTPTTAPTYAPTIYCEVGEYFQADSDGDQSCNPCRAGTYRNTTDVPAVCTTCPAGTFRAYSSVSANAVACADCPSGKIPSSDQGSCETCAAGKFVANDTACVDCPTGYFASSAEDDTCNACDSGYHTSVTMGASTCTACAAGRFSAAQSVNCTKCAAGRFSGSTKAEECTACSAGYFAEKTGQSACLKCSSELSTAYTSDEGASTCDVCTANYFMNSLTDECEECKDHIDCSASGSTLENLDVDAGYFRFDTTSYTAYECPFPVNCRGGNSTADQCRQGAQGPLCAVCKTGWTFNSWAGYCYECASLVGAVVTWSVLLLVIALLFGLAWVLYNRYVEQQERGDTNRPSIQEVAVAKMEETNNKLELMGALAAVFITSMQTMILLAENHESAGGEEVPVFLDQYLDFYGVVTVDLEATLPGFGCAFGGFEYRLILQTAAFVVVLLGSVAWYVKRRADNDDMAWQTLRYAVIFSELMLPAVSQTIVQTFRCASYDNGDYRYLLADLSIDCRSDLYAALQTYAGVMLLLLPVGLPLFALAYLVRLRPLVIGCENNDFEEVDELSTSPFLPLISPYTYDLAWFWFFVDMSRRMALTCGTILFVSVGEFLLFAVFTSFLSAVVHERCQPYNGEIFNAVASAQHWQNILFVTMMIMQDSEMFSETGFKTVAGVILLTNVCMLLTIFHPAVFAAQAHLSQQSKAVYDRTIRGSTLAQASPMHGSCQDSQATRLRGETDMDASMPHLPPEPPVEFEGFLTKSAKNARTLEGLQVEMVGMELEAVLAPTGATNCAADRDNVPLNFNPHYGHTHA